MTHPQHLHATQYTNQPTEDDSVAVQASSSPLSPSVDVASPQQQSHTLQQSSAPSSSGDYISLQQEEIMYNNDNTQASESTLSPAHAQPMAVDASSNASKTRVNFSNDEKQEHIVIDINNNDNNQVQIHQNGAASTTSSVTSSCDSVALIINHGDNKSNGAARTETIVEFKQNTDEQSQQTLKVTETISINNTSEEVDSPKVKRSCSELVRFYLTKLFFAVLYGIRDYFKRLIIMPFKKKNPSKRKPFKILVSSFFAAILGIFFVSSLHYFLLAPNQFSFMIGSFGACAVLLYAEPESPLAQPRNLVIGQLIGATVGVCVKHAIGDWPYVAAPFAVAITIFMMQFTCTVHPPAGATALIAIMSPWMPWNGFMYIIMPTLTGTLCLLLAAVIVNNVTRQYPQYWF